MSYVGKGGSGCSSKGCPWGKKKLNTTPGKGAVLLPTPALTFLPRHKPRRRWGLLPCSLPCDWAGTPCLSRPPYSLCCHLNRIAVLEHCLPIPSPPNSLHWAAETLPLGQNSWQYSPRPAINQETSLNLREVLVLGTSPFPRFQQLRQAPEIPSHSPSSPALVGHPGPAASPVIFLPKNCSDLLSIGPGPSPFTCAGGGFSIFLCSLLALVKQLVTLLAAGWQQLLQCLAPHWFPKVMLVLVGFITIIVSFPTPSCLSSASFGLTPGRQPEESQAGKCRHRFHFPPPPQAGFSRVPGSGRFSTVPSHRVPSQQLHLG